MLTSLIEAIAVFLIAAVSGGTPKRVRDSEGFRYAEAHDLTAPDIVIRRFAIVPI